MVCDLVQARKEIYFYNYSRLVKLQPEFKALQERIRNDELIQINEVDAPIYKDFYPYNQVVNGSIPITEELVKAMLVNSFQPWGHAICLSITLLGKEEWIS